MVTADPQSMFLSNAAGITPYIILLHMQELGLGGRCVVGSSSGSGKGVGIGQEVLGWWEWFGFGSSSSSISEDVELPNVDPNPTNFPLTASMHGGCLWVGGEGVGGGAGVVDHDIHIREVAQSISRNMISFWKDVIRLEC